MVKRLFSGVQPTGIITLGNYLGAIKQFVELQTEYESYLAVVDLHAITIPKVPAELHQNIRTVAKLFLACGLKPAHATIFVQSHVPAHSELGWILTSLTSMGRLSRMTQFKDKSQELKTSSISAGLFTYPALMAADVLLYSHRDEAEEVIVPVGHDQKQHVELLRDLSELFNRKFGPTFTVPKVKIPERAGRIMSLLDPRRKMSKSDPEGSYISLLDSKDVIRKKIALAVTDSGTEIIFDEVDKPALANLITIMSLLKGITPAEVTRNCKGQGYAEFKEALSEALIEHLLPIQERFQMIPDPEVESLLGQAARRANAVAERTLKEVKRRVGLG